MNMYIWVLHYVRLVKVKIKVKWLKHFTFVDKPDTKLLTHQRVCMIKCISAVQSESEFLLKIPRGNCLNQAKTQIFNSALKWQTWQTPAMDKRDVAGNASAQKWCTAASGFEPPVKCITQLSWMLYTWSLHIHSVLMICYHAQPRSSAKWCILQWRL